MTLLTDCPVCLETYDDPQILTACGHTFCRKCIDALRPRICPSCRKPIRYNGVRPNYALRMMLEDATLDGERPDGSTANEMSEVGLLEPSSAPGAPVSLVRRPSKMEEGSAEEDDKIRHLTELGLPWGLARLVKEEDAQIALRVFLLDNSGSTCHHDGQILQDGRLINCTRWEETKHMAVEQAKWNAHIGTPCDFVLLNSKQKRCNGVAMRQGIDFFRVDPQEGNAKDQCERLSQMLDRIQPGGPTPLVERLKEIYSRIEREHAALVQAEQQVIVIIATDGLPTSAISGTSTTLDKRQLAEMIRRLAGKLPVHIVIRLTTDDEDVVDFYNKLDEELEMPLEVIDDMKSEAKEIRTQGNGWFAYSPMIHMMREQGTFVKLFDLLDERRLMPMEALLLARMMLQESKDTSVPRDPEELCVFAERFLAKAKPVYNPLWRGKGPCIHVSSLRRALIPWRQRVAACCMQRRKSSNHVEGLWGRTLLVLSAAFGSRKH